MSRFKAHDAGGLPPFQCKCGKLVDSATALNYDGKPKPGDFSYCLDCGALLVFEKGLRLRLADADDMDDLTQEDFDELRQARAVLEEYWRHRSAN